MTHVDDALQHHNREAGNTKYDMAGFTVEVATPEHWKQVNAWGNGENWNIGFQDAACFMPVDPEGFFVGLVDGEPVSAVSLVNYSDEFAVWGHYLVAPGKRGHGYGIEVCKAASRHAGGRVTAGDAMPEQVENYSKDGSRPVHKTIHFLGALTGATVVDDSVDAVSEKDLDAIADYDATAFPARRRTFLERWLFAPGHSAVVRRGASGEVTGYAVLRPAPSGHRLGPIVANDADTARALIATVLAPLPSGEMVSAFCPDVQPATAGLLGELGLQEHFHVFRMYRGDVPEHQPERMFAISSLELG